MRTWSKVVGFLAVVLIFTFGMTFTVSPEEEFHAKEGFYVGVTVPYNTIGGDFDGERMLVSQVDLIIVPEIESNYGWGIILGGRDPKGAVELSYLRSKHDATWLGAKGEVVYNLVNLDAKGYFLVDKPTQPYLLFGVSFPWLVVKDGSASATEVGDATYRGVGFNVGGGIAYYFHPKVAISGGIVYRWISYGSAEGVETSGKLDDSLDGSGVNFNVGMTFTF